MPYEYSSVEGEDFYFVAPTASPPPFCADQQAWERARQIRSLESVRGFLSLYPNSPLEKEARDLLAALIKENPTIATNPPPVFAPAASTSALTPIIPLPHGKVTKFDGTPTQQYSEDLGKGVRLEMVAVKGGTFEREKVPVTLSNFWIAKFEVTQAQWRAVMGNNPSKFKGDNLPIETVSWNDAKEFCKKLNAKLGLKDDEGYRLLTEAEWEYAARAGSKTEFAFGDTINPEIVNIEPGLAQLGEQHRLHPEPICRQLA